jgi:predicted Zn-dependent protease
LAHEMAHVYQNHHERITQTVGRNQWMVLASMVAAGLLAYAGQVDPAMASAQVGLAAVIQKNLNYSRELEQEADRLGLELLKNSGFDPSAMPRFFSRLYHQQRFMDNKEKAFLQTHPLNQERINDTLQRLGQSHYDHPQPSPEFLAWREITRQLTQQRPFGKDSFAQSLQRARRGQAVDFSAWMNLSSGLWAMLMTQQPTEWPTQDASSAVAQTRFDRLLALGSQQQAETILHTSLTRWPQDPNWLDRHARWLSNSASSSQIHFVTAEAARLRGDIRYATDQYCAGIHQPKEQPQHDYWAQRARARLLPWRYMDMGNDETASRLKNCLKHVFPS